MVLSNATHQPIEIGQWANDIQKLTIAGWAGRNQAAVQAHIDELAEIGVPRPVSTPVFYQVAAALLTHSNVIEFAGEGSSGEAEAVVFAQNGQTFISVGSDHTDRELETVGVTISKQVCAKPVAANYWPIQDVYDHWDQLILRSWLVEDGVETLYQEGPLATNRHFDNLVELFASDHPSAKGTLPDGNALFCGTLPVFGKIRGAERFKLELEDPVLGRSIFHQYDCQHLPVAG